MLVEFRIAEASGTAERRVALEMLDDNLPGVRRITLGADKGYHTREFVHECRRRTAHVAEKATHSQLDRRTSRQPGYGVSQRIRKRVEEIFGWTKTVGGFRRTRYRGSRKRRWLHTRMAKLLPTPP